jgi:sporulation and cell division protein SsgA
VHVWPSPASAGGEPGSVLNIELSSPFGKAHLEAPAREVSDFVRQTYRIVPDGQESDHPNPPCCDQKPARRRVWVAAIITPAAAVTADGVSSPIVKTIPAPNWSTPVSTVGTRPPRAGEVRGRARDAAES